MIRAILRRWQRRRQAPVRVHCSRRFQPRLEGLEDRTLLSIYTVNTLTDTGGPGGSGSGYTGDLRYALTNAGSGDTINFSLSGTVNLASALPSIAQSITINGPGVTVERRR